MNLNFWIIQILNALSLGTLLFLVAAGLSMIFGLMRIVNVAHGSFYMLGAYIALEALRVVHNQLVAALIAGITMGVLGALLQSTLIARLKNDSLRQILLTFGFLLVVGDFALISLARYVSDPAAAAGTGGLRAHRRYQLPRLSPVRHRRRRSARRGA